MSTQISIALATYNGEKYLREQLDSICSQTLKPYEIVVSDDGSSDGTLSVLNEYKSIFNIQIINAGYKNINPNNITAIMLSMPGQTL